MNDQQTRAIARMNGYDAYKQGRHPEDNPHEAGSDQLAVWLAGWEQAEHEDFTAFRATRLKAEKNMAAKDVMTARTQAWIRGELLV